MSADPGLRWLREGEDDGGWRTFEITSRGDRVRARLHLPSGGGPHPLALVACADSRTVVPGEGLAVATLDLPLLGARCSPKWTERLEACLAGGAESATDRALVDEFLGQAESDLRAVLDVCADLDAVDGARAGVVGIGPGAAAAARLRGADDGPRAFVLSAAGLCDALAPDGADASPDPETALRALAQALA